MTRPTRAIVTVGVPQAKNFDRYHERFERTIRASGYGAADIYLRYRSDWPPGALPHVVVHYGFKIHAIREAQRRGATSILYLDVPCNAVRSLEPLWEQIERDGHFFMIGGDHLGNFTSDRCLAQFDVTRDEAMDIQMFSGTILGFDLRKERTRAFLNQLQGYANPLHFNGTHNGLGSNADMKLSEDPRFWEHRSDEGYMTLIARELGMEPTWRGGLFVGDTPVHATALLRSGYDIPQGAAPDPVLEVVAEHTVDASLVGAGGWVLDAGCRNFGFARSMAERGCRVVAMDPDPTIEDPKIEGVEFARAALGSLTGGAALIMTPDPQARYISSDATILTTPVGYTVERVPALRIEDVMAARGIRLWDAVKLDVEGSEYEILRHWPGRIARQISIEFHDHVLKRPTALYNEIFSHLERFGYRLVQHAREARYCAGENYWDSLLVLDSPSRDSRAW